METITRTWIKIGIEIVTSAVKNDFIGLNIIGIHIQL